MYQILKDSTEYIAITIDRYRMSEMKKKNETNSIKFVYI